MVFNFLRMKRWKIMHFILMSFFSLLSYFISAQSANNEIDSLLREINKAKVDTLKVNLFFQIANFYRGEDQEKRQEFLQKAYQLSKAINFEKGMAEYYFAIGKTRGKYGRFEEAILYFDSALVIYDKLNLDTDVLYCYLFKGKSFAAINQNASAFESFYKGVSISSIEKNANLFYFFHEEIALIYSNLGLYDEALIKMNECLQIAQKTGEQRNVMLTKGNIGHILYAKEKYAEGLEYLLESLSYFEKIQEWDQVGPLYNNIAIIYGAVNKPDEATAYLEKSKELCLRSNDIKCELTVRKNICQIYIQSEQYDKALKDLKTLELKYRDLDDRLGISKAYILFGKLYEKENNNIAAVKYYLDAKNILKEFDNLEDKIELDRTLADFYFRTGDFQNADKFMDDVISTGIQMGLKLPISMAYEIKHQVAIKQGDFKNALLYYKKHREYSDSFNLENQKYEFDRVIFNYQTESKINEISRLETEAEIQELLITKKEQQKQNILISFVFGIAVVLTLLLMYFKNKETKTKNKELELNLKALRSQMNSHFIFNALASIYSFIQSQKEDKAGEYLIKYANLVRYFLKNSRREFSDLHSEIEILENYLDLEKARTNNSFDYYINFDESIDPESISIPSLIVQPLAENAVWHGIANLKEKRGRIDIVFEIKEDRLKVAVLNNSSISDNNKELPNKPKIIKDESYGLEIIKERLEFIGLKNNCTTELIIKKEEDSCKVMLWVPFNSDY
jgi:tetratricopeptide (TPR) repeat protein/two-component sensor histidine kinase